MFMFMLDTIWCCTIDIFSHIIIVNHYCCGFINLVFTAVP